MLVLNGVNGYESRHPAALIGKLFHRALYRDLKFRVLTAKLSRNLDLLREAAGGCLITHGLRPKPVIQFAAIDNDF